MHTNLIDNKKYIGITCRSVQQRWGNNGKGYLSKNKKGDYSQPAIANAIMRYGWENFSHEILYEHLSQKQAEELEQKLIEEYNTRDSRYGYNIREGGGSHGHLSEQTKDKMRGENNPMFGHTKEFMTEEERYARGKATRGKHRSQETKEKISQKTKEFYKTHTHHRVGKHMTEEQKSYMREIMLNREFPEETKKKMSENHYDATGANNPRARGVRCVETGEEFACAKDAGLIYNNVPSNPRCGIRDCCNKRRKTSGVHKETGEPLHWEWIN